MLKKKNLWQGEKEKRKKKPTRCSQNTNDKPEKNYTTHPTKNYSPSCKKSSQRQIRKMDKGCKQFIEKGIRMAVKHLESSFSLSPSKQCKLELQEPPCSIYHTGKFQLDNALSDGVLRPQGTFITNSWWGTPSVQPL